MHSNSRLIPITIPPQIINLSDTIYGTSLGKCTSQTIKKLPPIRSLNEYHSHALLPKPIHRHVAFDLNEEQISESQKIISITSTTKRQPSAGIYIKKHSNSQIILSRPHTAMGDERVIYKC